VEAALVKTVNDVGDAERPLPRASERSSDAVAHRLQADGSSTQREPGLGERPGPEFIDDFSEALPAGRVIGSTVSGGITRHGVDRERVISIDNGALRIQPLVKSRWGRAGLAYGPYRRQNGLAFGVSILNGHNTSQTGPLLDSPRQRLTQWARGSGTTPPAARLRRWLGGYQRRYFWGHLKQWLISGSKLFQATRVDENLAVGWFPREATGNPLVEGNSFVMHALGPECGELWARGGTGTLRSVRGVQNVQMYYLVVLRERGAAYYAASVPDVPSFSPYPGLTPLAIDPAVVEQTVFAGVHQSVLGQIGFRAETRVFRAQVAMLDGFDRWFGSASAADTLTGDGELADRPAEVAGRWILRSGAFRRTARGTFGLDQINVASLHPESPAGLVHAVIEIGDPPVDGIGLLFRVRDERNYWAFLTGTSGCELVITENGLVSRFPATQAHRLAPNAANSVQVSDDGRHVRLSLNGDLVYDTQFADERLAQAAGVGMQCPAGVAAFLRDFEAHPRIIPVPRQIDLGMAWTIQGDRVVAADDFTGPAGDLAGRVTATGGLSWRRLLGHGEFQLNGEGAAKVRGSVTEPCPDRTAYTVPWSSHRLADVSVEITPPGTHKGVLERGRGGVVFWQDADNYITLSVFIDDWYGMSIAAFFYRDGYEELYDAVWSNIGKRIHWGVPYRFRVVFDSTRFTAYVNDEPVLYRALHDVYPDWQQLLINEVGLVANWEWGTDTGSIFRDFVARDRA
jgi:hypothetical protein